MTARVLAWFLQCDEAFCERVFWAFDPGGGLHQVQPIELRRGASDAGWSRRNGWDLCPDHGTPSERAVALAIQRAAREAIEGLDAIGYSDGFVITPEQEHILLRQIPPEKVPMMFGAEPTRDLALMHVMYGKPVIVTDQKTIPPRYYDLRDARP